MEYIYDPPDFTKELPQRYADSHKGSYGKVLIAAGSKNMCGAAYFSAMAAYRTGAGLVYIYTEECNRVILQQLIPEAVLITYVPGQDNETLLQNAIRGKDAIVAGPGLGKSTESKKIVKAVLETEGIPRIFDADALNLLAEDAGLWKEAQRPFIITPHLAEMARLSGRSVAEIKENKNSAAIEFSREHHVITVLKDAKTVTSDGTHCYLNEKGNHGMATGGSGDVLSGIIGGLLAQRMDLLSAAKLGVYLHALAGDEARRQRGAYSMTARDILENILNVPGL